MARVFARLKLRLLRNRLSRSNVIQVFGFIVTWLLAIGAGLALGFAYGGLIRAVEDDSLVINGMVFTIAFLGWLLLPIVAASIDDSMEARQFELLPLDSRQLAMGLAVSALVGPGALLTGLIFLVGILFGYGLGPATPIQLAAAFAGLLFLVTTSRWVTTMLTDLLRSRRTQEVGALVVTVFLTLPGVLSALLFRPGSEPDVSAILSALEPLAWTPFGVFGLVIDGVYTGAWLDVVIGIVYSAAVLWVVWSLFAVSVQRLQTRPAVNRRSRKRRGTMTALFPRRVPLPRHPVGSVAAKELKYLLRDSRVKAQLIGGAVATVVLVGTGGAVLADTPYAPFSAAFIGFLVTASIIPNQFGFDGGSFWAYQTSSVRLIDVLKGKNLGWAVVSVPLVVVTAVAASAVSRDATYLVAGVLTGVSVVAMFTAGGNLTSVLGAYPLPETNLFGSRNVSGTALIFSFLGLGLSGLLVIPIVLLVGLPAYLSGPLLATLGAVGAAVYGIGGYALSLRWIKPLIEGRALKLLETIDEE